MPDLVTHISVAFIVKALNRRPMTPVFVAGTVLPDLLSRIPEKALLLCHEHVLELPRFVLYTPAVAHLPTGILVWSLALAFFFPEDVRLLAWWNLLAGALLHVLLDLTQAHLGSAYTLLFPFLYLKHLEVGWLGTETSLIAAPFLAALAAVLWWRCQRRPVP